MPIFIDPANAHWVPVENTELVRLRDAERRLAELQEAVRWERECEVFDRWAIKFCVPITHEWKRVVYSARAAVDTIVKEL